MALSLGSPPPVVNRHRASMEPGLSSPREFPHYERRPSDRLVLSKHNLMLNDVKHYSTQGDSLTDLMSLNLVFYLHFQDRSDVEKQ